MPNALPRRLSAAAFTFTASADLDRRRISGTLLPYGVQGATSWGPVQVQAGAVTIPDRVLFLIGHDDDRPVGLLAEHDDGPDALVGSFTVAATPNGDTALLEAAEGIRAGLSVGLDVHDYTTGKDGVVTITAATLRETSLVTFAAFPGAAVETVAASETSDPAPGTDATPDREDPTVDTTTTPPVAEATDTPDAAPLTASVPAPRATVRDPFPYGPTVQASFFRDLVTASEGDRDAAERVRRAQVMLTAAQDTTDVAEVIPPGYRPDLYVGQLGVTRPVVDAFARYTITDATPFRVPVFGSASGLMADHVEGTNPTDGSVTFDEVVVTPKAVSGRHRASREMLDASNPSVDAIIMAAIREEYAAEAEAYVAAAFIAGATAGTAVAEATATAGVVANLVAYQVARKQGAGFLLAGTDLFPALALEVDGAGRPMNPYRGATNADGGMSAGAQAIDVAGLASPLAWSIAGGLLGTRNDAATWESGLRMWRWEEKDGPANIEFAAFGYIAAEVLRPAGVVKFSVTPTP